ncbi:unnamed protein product [Closterium sp. NIES-53]
MRLFCTSTLLKAQTAFSCIKRCYSQQALMSHLPATPRLVLAYAVPELQGVSICTMSKTHQDAYSSEPSRSQPYTLSSPTTSLLHSPPSPVYPSLTLRQPHAFFPAATHQPQPAPLVLPSTSPTQSSSSQLNLHASPLFRMHSPLSSAFLLLTTLSNDPSPATLRTSQPTSESLFTDPLPHTSP